MIFSQSIHPHGFHARPTLPVLDCGFGVVVLDPGAACRLAITQGKIADVSELVAAATRLFGAIADLRLRGVSEVAFREVQRLNEIIARHTRTFTSTRGTEFAADADALCNSITLAHTMAAQLPNAPAVAKAHAELLGIADEIQSRGTLPPAVEEERRKAASGGITGTEMLVVGLIALTIGGVVWWRLSR